jgi:drug/metabolite transporter (DMT)-like permease
MEGGGGGCRMVAEAARPAAGMVGVQLLFSVLNILIKLALNDGMDARVLVAYRFMFASVFLCPIAFFVERFAPALLHASFIICVCACFFLKFETATHM